MFRKLANKILDFSIYFSFDAGGFKRHQREFDANEMSLSMKGQNILITGGTSGLGLEVLREFYIREATQLVIARNKQKAISNISRFYKRKDNIEIDLLTGDMANYDEIVEALENRKLNPFNVVIFNAGGMPSSKRLNTFGYESMFAGQVIGHYVLFRWLEDRKLLAPGCRITWVSSGGMYLKKLKLNDLNFVQNEFDKISAYANAKRAQVILNEELAESHRDSNLVFSCMHPGWVNTEAVKESLPSFYANMEFRLRSPEEGADTIIWLSSAQRQIPSGGFWFDRKQRPTYPFPWTREKKELRERLMDLLETQYQAVISPLQ